MKFSSAQKIRECCDSMKLADLPRSKNRALIDATANGSPPIPEDEARKSGYTVNVNRLDLNRVIQDVCGQYYNALVAPGTYFKVTLTHGPKDKRRDYGDLITEKINQRMKRGLAALRYIESKRNKFAQTALHGIGPVSWKNRETWCPTMHQICDVLIPSGTLLTMENLGHFAIYKRFTAAELSKLTSGPNVDEAWNMKAVNAALTWALKSSTGQTISADDLMTPELIQEAIKGDRGFYALDSIPTINAYDMYFYDDESEVHGWRRRMVIDCPSLTESGTIAKGEYLYKPKDDRIYAERLSEIIHFQFADGSIVAPFRYHSVRSLGFLFYATSQLQNRLYCQYMQSTFESLMQYFKGVDPATEQRPQMLNLIDKGFIPDGVTMLGRNERWQTDVNLVQSAFAINQQIMADSSTKFTQNFGEQAGGGAEKTATQIMAEVNAATAMVGSMLTRAYIYEEFEYREIGRRFCIAKSRDPDVRAFRADCIREGIPEECLDVNHWDISAERVIGAGNKQLEMAAVNMLMSQIDRLDPDAQRIVLRRFVHAAVSDPAETNLLVPLEQKQVTDSIHDAQLSAAPLMMGMLMGLKQGVNHGEYAAVLIGALNLEVEKANATGGMATQEQIAGMQNLAGLTIEGQPIEGNGAANHIAVLSQRNDPAAKTLTKQLNDQLSKLLNEVRALSQRLQEQQGNPENGQQQVDPENLVKLQGMQLINQAKAENAKANAALKMQISAEKHAQQLEQRASSDALNSAAKLKEVETQVAATDLITAGEIRRKGAENIKQGAE